MSAGRPSVRPSAPHSPDWSRQRREAPTSTTLLARIAALKDPDKPVVIVTVGMGRGVDTAALMAVSAVTGGKTYVAQDPQDIRQVFIDALLSRDCSGAVCTSR